MNVLGLAILGTALVGQQARAPVAPPPSCSVVNRDIGRGFTLTQYLFGGSSEFTLAYAPPASAIRADGLSQTGALQITFFQMRVEERAAQDSSSLVSPHIGFAGYEFRRADGSRIGSGSMRLDCGGGAVLSETYTAADVPDYVRAPLSSLVPFLNRAEDQCIRALRTDGRFRLGMGGTSPDAPRVIVENRMALGWALAQVGRLYQARLADAREGRCRIAPPPPPP